MPQQTTFLQLCDIFESISATTKRLEIQNILCAHLKRLSQEDPESLAPTLFLCVGTCYPEYFNIELGIGDHLIVGVVAEATGLTVKTVRQKYVSTGDLGTIAMQNRVRQLFIVNRELKTSEVLDRLRDIAKATGKNCTTVKRNIMLSLLNASSPLETKYIIRLFESKLKIGLALQTVLISLALAFQDTEAVVSEDNKTTSDGTIGLIKEAYNKQPNFDTLTKFILESGIQNLNNTCKITPGIPLKPMLAQPSANLTRAFSKVESGRSVSEFKYDGERVQIHFDGQRTKVFSRNSEDLSQKYPDLASLRLHDKSFIIDGEAVAFADNQILPFQVLSTRKRKNTDKIEVQVCVFGFDILYFDSEDLLHKPLEGRRDILSRNFQEQGDKFRFVDGLICKSVEEVEEHFRKALKNNCEGIMLKSLDSVYKPSLRTNSWIKMKSDYLDELGDSMDLVVIGAFYGKGRRTGSFGGFLLGCYNDETDKFEACCKIGTGFSDEELQRQYTKLSNEITADTSEYVYKKQGVKPDLWVKPTYVWEVKAASLSLSPIYSAGLLDDGKGISLRFPRFIREREDKAPKQATTSGQILRLYSENKNASSEEDEFN